MFACTGSLGNTLVRIFALQRICSGTIVTRTEELPRLRFCTTIEGNLTLSVKDGLATDEDFKIFDSLEEITGMREERECSTVDRGVS